MNLKKSLKILGLAAGSFAILVLFYLLAAYFLSRIGVNQQTGFRNDIVIYILSNGVHTDIVVPVKTDLMDWSRHIRFEHTANRDTTPELVAFGWGDKGFYLETPTWADLKFSVAFKATFALSTSAIHATFHRELKESEKCKRINIGRKEYKQLVAYISNSLLLDKEGRAIPIKTNASYGGNDAFYEATGKYSLFHTCNTWANNGLKACGQRAALWTAFDTGIFYHYTEE